MVASVWGLASMGPDFAGVRFSWLSGRVIVPDDYTPVFIACGILPLIAESLVWFVMGPLRPLPEFQKPNLTEPD